MEKHFDAKIELQPYPQTPRSLGRGVGKPHIPSIAMLDVLAYKQTGQVSWILSNFSFRVLTSRVSKAVKQCVTTNLQKSKILPVSS
jgi:hypothetical protein